MQSIILFRMPYIKGVVHQVDFAALLSELDVSYIVDMWGKRHRPAEVDIILTESMFKGLGWMTENGLSWAEYLERCNKYRHTLYISGKDKTEPQFYRLYLDNVTGGLSDVLTVTIKDGDKILYTGTANELTKQNVIAADDTLKIGQRRNLTVVFHYPESSGNDTQNHDLTFTLCAEATQTKNNPGRLFESGTTHKE